ncbi:MAG: hypothetical protein ACYDAZ_07580 [Thermoplasmataceae archaeon]
MKRFRLVYMKARKIMESGDSDASKKVGPYPGERNSTRSLFLRR